LTRSFSVIRPPVGAGLLSGPALSGFPFRRFRLYQIRVRVVSDSDFVSGGLWIGLSPFGGSDFIRSAFADLIDLTFPIRDRKDPAELNFGQSAVDVNCHRGASPAPGNR
ncbi:hypothetical protein ABT381_35400, partial [Streptomyces sp. NPDC000151]|uniref:hypothetical protein n=1 Tax=Streptomyces sp. NPDC000151 TaxID=3154244 RepID=UPI003326898D